MRTFFFLIVFFNLLFLGSAESDPLKNKLDKLKEIDTFVRTKKGFKVTGSEGFVAIDYNTNGAVKLVDRLEFSTNNFSPDVIKGWER